MWYYAERRGIIMEEIKWESLKIEIEEYLEAADDIEDGLSQSPTIESPNRAE